MTDVSDLFLQTQPVAATLPAKSAEKIAEEDAAFLKRLAEANDVQATVKRLGLFKKLAAKFIMARPITKQLVVSGLAFALLSTVVVPLSGALRSTKPDEAIVAKAEAQVPSAVGTPAIPAKSAPEKLAPAEVKNPNVTVSVVDTDWVPPAKAEPEPVEELKIDPAPAASQSEVPQIDNGIALPGDEPSANDLINKWGFGAGDTAVSQTVVEIPAIPQQPPQDSAAAVVSSVPTVVAHEAGKPLDSKNAETPKEVQQDAVTYEVLTAKGQESLFWRMKGKDEATKQFFVVIHAVDAKGKAYSVPIRSADTGDIAMSDHWALEIDRSNYERLSKEIKKNGNLKNPIIGKAASKTTMPEWTVTTSGRMITKW